MTRATVDRWSSRLLPNAFLPSSIRLFFPVVRKRKQSLPHHCNSDIKKKERGMWEPMSVTPASGRGRRGRRGRRAAEGEEEGGGEGGGEPMRIQIAAPMPYRGVAGSGQRNLNDNSTNSTRPIAAPLPENLEPLLPEERRPRVVNSTFVVRDTVRGPAQRTEYETREGGYHYTRDEEPETLADAAASVGRATIDRNAARRVTRTPGHELHFDPYEEGAYVARPVSDRERSDLGRAMQELIVGKRDELSRTGVLPPAGSVGAGPANTTPSVPPPPPATLRTNRPYRMFEPDRVAGVPTDQLLEASVRDPYVAFTEHPALARIRQQDASVQALNEVRLLAAHAMQAHPDGLTLEEWTRCMRDAGLHASPKIEQPDMARLRQRAAEARQQQAAKLHYVLFRFSKVLDHHLQELLQGLTNNQAASRDAGIEDAEEDKFRAWSEDFVRTLLALEVVRPSQPTPPSATPLPAKRYRMFTFLFTL
jgi:hypothetical protein